MKKVTDKLSYDPKIKLGIGSDGTKVFEGQFGLRKVAVKRIDSEKIDLGQREENSLLLGDIHENIVKYFCTEEFEENIFIALEICDFDLSKYFGDPASNELLERLQNEFKVIDILQQTTKGLKSLHAKGIIHRDIKPQNILVQRQTDGGEWKVKISDFGISKILQANRSQTQMTLPSSMPLCAALEVLNDRITTKMSDVYSLGCFFFYMLSGGSYPFDVNIINTPCTKKLSKAYIEFIKVETDEKILALNLIEKMLNDDPNQRPTAAKIEHHPTFWDSKKKMDFLTDVYMKNENDPNVPKFVAALETKKSQVIGGNWMTPLADALKEDLTNRTYQFDSLDSLLRYIRNKKTHFVDEKKQEVRDAFGTSQDDVIVYFTRLFPKLIMHVLNVVAQNIGMFETVFKDKYLKFYN